MPRRAPAPSRAQTRSAGWTRPNICVSNVRPRHPVASVTCLPHNGVTRGVTGAWDMPACYLGDPRECGGCRRISLGGRAGAQIGEKSWEPDAKNLRKCYLGAVLRCDTGRDSRASDAQPGVLPWLCKLIASARRPMSHSRLSVQLAVCAPLHTRMIPARRRRCLANFMPTSVPFSCFICGSKIRSTFPMVTATEASAPVCDELQDRHYHACVRGDDQGTGRSLPNAVA